MANIISKLIFCSMHRSHDCHMFIYPVGSHGQLGHGNLVRQNVPKVVDHLKDHPIHLVSCGNFHTMVVTKRGTIFMFGKNNFGDVSLLLQ